MVRLQVLLDEVEMREVQRAVRARRMTVAEWCARRCAPSGAASPVATRAGRWPR